MTLATHPSMAAATQLTRDGRLAEATALIRALLAGDAPAEYAAPAAGAPALDLLPDRVSYAPKARTPLHDAPPGPRARFSRAPIPAPPAPLPTSSMSLPTRPTPCRSS
ncbi:MAG: hypothetical protein H7X93_06020 [Sphingomonadaceae bacterium]|nr:hypothetical protein [Sphingomonadaceae bacterium]